VAEFVEGRPSAPGGATGAFDFSTVADPQFASLGPLPGGRVLSRMFWAFQCMSGTAAFFRIGFVLSGSGEASAVNFRAGRSLIRGTGLALAGQPTMRAVMNIRALTWGLMYPGLELRSGSEWLVIGWSGGSTGTGQVRVSLEFVWPGWYGGQFGSVVPPPAEASE